MIRETNYYKLYYIFSFMYIIAHQSSYCLVCNVQQNLQSSVV